MAENARESKTTAAAERRERLAAELRANLKKRKVRQRAAETRDAAAGKDTKKPE